MQPDPIKDDLYFYMQTISKIPMITQEREVFLGWLIKSGRDTGRAREELIESNLRWVVTIARKYLSSGWPIMDLIEEGNIGLMRAVEKFDPARGYRLTTYATWWIKQSITRALMDKKNEIRIPVHIHDALIPIIRARKALEFRLNRKPTNREIAKVLKIRVKKVNELLGYLEINNTKSLNFDLPDGNEMGDYIPDDQQDQHTEVERRQTSEQVIDCMNQKLSERDTDILLSRANGETLGRIGKRYKLTRERIRQLQEKAEHKIRVRGQELRELM